MAFITQQDFGSIIGEAWANAILQEPQSWEIARSVAEGRITTITGVEPPADAADAPGWAKNAAAAMILYARIGFMSPTNEQLEWAASLNRTALADLERQKLSAPPDRAKPESGAVEGLINDL